MRGYQPDTGEIVIRGALPRPSCHCRKYTLREESTKAIAEGVEHSYERCCAPGAGPVSRRQTDAP